MWKKCDICFKDIKNMGSPKMTSNVLNELLPMGYAHFFFRKFEFVFPQKHKRGPTRNLPSQKSYCPPLEMKPLKEISKVVQGPHQKLRELNFSRTRSSILTANELTRMRSLFFSLWGSLIKVKPGIAGAKSLTVDWQFLCGFQNLPYSEVQEEQIRNT